MDCVLCIMDRDVADWRTLVSMSVQFYSSRPDEFMAIREADIDEATAALEALVQADFSLHLLIPDDMDLLAKSMIAEGLDVPTTFEEWLVELLWSPDSSETIWLVSNVLISALSGANDAVINQVAMRWAASSEDATNPDAWHTRSAFFLEPETSRSALSESLPYMCTALLELRDVARDATSNRRTVLLHIVG